MRRIHHVKHAVANFLIIFGQAAHLARKGHCHSIPIISLQPAAQRGSQRAVIGNHLVIIQPRTLRAAHMQARLPGIVLGGSLGATKLGAFFHVVFPLSISGLVTGSVLVFTGCMTAYTTPQLLGGTDTRVLATMIYQ